MTAMKEVNVKVTENQEWFVEVNVPAHLFNEIDIVDNSDSLPTTDFASGPMKTSVGEKGKGEIVTVGSPFCGKPR